MISRQTQLTTSRRDALAETLRSTADLLRQRRAADVPEQDIEDYVALDWLEWHGGSLRLTITGDNICKQLGVRTA
ncbi:MAG: hypothetical protein EPO12_17545 [Aquabacterium sp.]|jgi:hypothetical protein|nr:MAG: hypothetical protein EPO12_17545 [Aquabacterium sp.]